MSDVLEENPTASREPTPAQVPLRMGRNDDAAFERIMANIAKLGLNDNLFELETVGYTVVKGALSQDQVARAKAAILRRVEAKTGRKMDPDNATSADFHGMAYQHYLIFDDPVFQEILMEPRPLALMTYLLGESCVLSSMGCHFRGPGGLPLGFHADGSGTGMATSYSAVANCNYALTPYSREAGAIVMMPRSQYKMRQPTAHENWKAGGKTMPEILDRNPNPNDLDIIDWECPAGGVTMNIDPGDAVVWHGNTWHGGWRREIPGLRMNLATFMCRQHILPQERRGDDRFPDVFERYKDEPRFARLMGANLYNGWREEGPDFSESRRPPSGRFD